MRKRTFLAAPAIAVPLVFMSASPSAAWARVACGDWGLCLYYNSNLKGANVGLSGNIYNYATAMVPLADSNIKFNNWGNGGGQNVADNTASAYNYKEYTAYRIFSNAGYSGYVDQFDPEGYGTYFGNLRNTYNKNNSQLG